MSRLNQILLFFCMILILVTPLSEAKERKGAEILIRKTDGIEIQGELIAVKSDSLLVLDARTGVDITTSIKDIFNIKRIRKSHPWRGTGVGLLVGIASGWAYGKYFPGDAEPDSFYPPFYATLFAVPGAIIGWITSGLIALDKTYLIQGRPSRFVEAALNDLRKKARVKDFN